MERRQWTLLAAGGVALGLFWLAIVQPLRQDVARLREALPGFQQELREMGQLRDAVTQLQADERTLEQWVEERGGQFTLFAHVTEVAQRLGLPLASLTPDARPISDRWQVERVEIALDNVRMPALIAFLHELTAPGKLVRVEHFKLQGGTKGLSVTLQAQTLSLRS